MNIFTKAEVQQHKLLRSKEISNDLREAIVVAHNSESGYKSVFTQVKVHHFTVINHK